MNTRYTLAVLLTGTMIVFSSCKKDDTQSSTTDSTSTTSSTSTTGAGPNTLVYEGKAMPNMIGNCEFSSSLTVTGDVTTSDGTNYFISVDFKNAEPASGTYTTVQLPQDPLNDSQCHVGIVRTAGTFVTGMLAPTGASVKVVKNGMKYTVSFGTIKFNVKSGSNGTRSVSCAGFGCQ